MKISNPIHLNPTFSDIVLLFLFVPSTPDTSFLYRLPAAPPHPYCHTPEILKDPRERGRGHLIIL